MAETVKKKFNPSLNKTPMPEQDPAERAQNFSEVALGYTSDMAVLEAERCLDCKNMPCVSGCPVNISIPDFIREIKKGDFESAYKIIRESSSLPAICGRVCPQERQCESKCVRGIKGEAVAIGRLERFAADTHAEVNAVVKQDAPTGERVAVVGSGPAGLAAAAELNSLGYRVTVYEALHTEGGVLTYGIPEFRLPKSVVRREVDGLRSLGVEFVTNVIIGKTLLVDDLFDMGYKAVFIGTGAGLPQFMSIPGESFKGVYSANEYLTRCNLMGAYRENSETPVMKGGSVAVVGGGNVAMDAARVAKRLGAESVRIVYRRSAEELPARREEVEHAIAEGIEFLYLTSPIEILGYENKENRRDPKNGCVTSMKCIKMKLGEPDERGRRRPIPEEGSEFTIPADTVIMAIGTTPNPLIKSTTEGLSVNERGGIVTDDSTMTTKAGVFAGGDAVSGAATVISAMGAGKRAAHAIDEYIRSNK